jgi:hypothetical protein
VLSRLRAVSSRVSAEEMVYLLAIEMRILNQVRIIDIFFGQFRCCYLRKN